MEEGNVFTTIPPEPVEKKPGQLTNEQIKEFFEEGVVLVKDFFKKEELDRVKDAINDLVEDLAQRLYKAGKIKNLYQDLGFNKRLTAIEKEFPGANIILHKLAMLPQACKDLWTNERLLNVVEQLVGPDIMGHPVWNLRTKTPNNEATVVPWHQDTAYLDVEDASKVLMVTAWIPLIDANLTNGCMEMARRGHRSGKIGKHTCCYAGTWYVMIDPEEMKESLGVDPENDFEVMPVPYGSMLLFNNITPHRSLPNYSQNIRWSMDLRWQNSHLPHGFHLKDGVVFRDSNNPDHVIDWETFEKVDRHKVQSVASGLGGIRKQMGIHGKTNNGAEIGVDIEPNSHIQFPDETDTSDEFDTTITGPWMNRWEIVNHNRHVAAMTDDDKTWTKA